MNNNLGMQPNDFNNQNGAMQNQANNMQIVELIAPVAMKLELNSQLEKVEELLLKV